jgi:hypothetical protein
MMEQLAFTVTCEWDDEAHVWYVSDSNIPGLSGEAPTEAALDKLLDERIPELLRLNMPELFRREAPRQVPFDLLKRSHRHLELACA